MIINTRVDPRPGQTFKQGCFDENIGQTVEFTIEGSDHVGLGTITATSVAEDGSHAWITCDVPNLASDTLDIGPMYLSTEDGAGYTGYAEEGV